MSDTQPPPDDLPDLPEPPPLNPMPSYLRRGIVVALLALIPVLVGLVLWLDDDPNNDDPTVTTGTTQEETTSTESTTTTTEPTTSTTEPTTSSSTTTTSGQPMTVPATCRPTARNNGTTLRQQFPTDESTGPSGRGLDEDRLQPSGQASTWNITTANTVVEGVYHHGRIVVKAPNVTIRASVICGTGGLIIQSSSSGLVIEDSIILGEVGTVMANAEDGQPCEAAVGYGNYTLRSSEIMNCVDGLKVSGSVVANDNYFHDNYAKRGGPNGEPGGGTHNDTVQQANSPLNNFTYQRNSAYQDPCTSNRHFQMAPTANPGGGTWRIDSNFFYGIRLINVDRGERVDDGLMRENVLAGSVTEGPFPDPLYAGDGMSTVHRSGNTYETGGASADDNYVKANYTCVSG